MKRIFRSFILIIFIFTLCSCSRGENPVNGVKHIEKVQRKDEKHDTFKADNVEKATLPKVEKKQGEAANKAMVLYKGPIEHIFFHPLVVYPKLAFDGDRMAKGYNDWFVTVKEFNKIIQSLYQRNYILIKMSDLFEERVSNGKTQFVKKELNLPIGKKPLIISVDDINYYPYMLANGNAYKLIIDSQGKIATYSKDPNGKEVVSEDNEIVPIINSFVSNHPDFSLNGAKGILALTGYEGVLGYRTNNLASNNFMREKEGALKVIAKLKSDGWEFASHGYGHLNTRAISLNTLKRDTTRWLKEVQPLIGQTKIYIYPFGSSVLPKDPKFRFLEGMGFNVFCSVGPKPYLSFTNQYAMMDRVHIDGIALEKQKQIVDRFFDSTAILDQERFALK